MNAIIFIAALYYAVDDVFASNLVEIAFNSQTHCNVCQILVCGGGIVKTPENYASLRQNGRVYQLERAMYKLPTAGRPLSQGVDLSALAAERAPLYRRFRDASIDNNGKAADTAAAIWRDFCADSDSERA